MLRDEKINETTTFMGVLILEQNCSYLFHAGPEGGVYGDSADGVDEPSHEGGGGEGEEHTGHGSHRQQRVIAPDTVIDLTTKQLLSKQRP